MSGVTKTAKICNQRGLHARAAAKMVKLVETFDASVMVTKGEMSVPGNSIMSLLLLAASRETDITVTAMGKDAGTAVDAVISLIERKFDEEE